MTDDNAEPRVPSVTRRGVGKGIAAGLSALGVAALSGTAAAQPPQSDDTLVFGDDKGWMYHDVQNGDLVIGHPDGELWRYDTSAGTIIPKQQIGTASDRVDHYGAAADYDSVTTDEVNNIEVINESRYSGDLGADINDAVAALPSDGGRIIIAARDDGSRYTLSTKAVLDKHVTIEGPGREVQLIDVQADVIALEAQTSDVVIRDVEVTASNLASHSSALIHLAGRCRLATSSVTGAGDNNVAITDTYSGQSARVDDCRLRSAGQNTPGTENDADKEGNNLLIATGSNLTWTESPPPDGSGINECHVHETELSGASRNGATLWAGSTHTLTGNLYSANGQTGLYWGPGGSAGVAFGGHFEANPESLRFDAQHPAALVITSQLPNGVTDNNTNNAWMMGGIWGSFRHIEASSVGLDNNQSFEIKDTGGTYRSVARVDTSDITRIGRRELPTRIEQGQEDLSANNGFADGVVAFHDGSGTPPKDLYWWDDGNSQWVRVGDETTTI